MAAMTFIHWAPMACRAETGLPLILATGTNERGASLPGVHPAGANGRHRSDRRAVGHGGPGRRPEPSAPGPPARPAIHSPCPAVARTGDAARPGTRPAPAGPWLSGAAARRPGLDHGVGFSPIA